MAASLESESVVKTLQSQLADAELAAKVANERLQETEEERIWSKQVGLKP